MSVFSLPGVSSSRLVYYWLTILDRSKHYFAFSRSVTQWNIFCLLSILHCTQMETMFCFRDDRARSTWNARKVNHVFRAKKWRADWHPCKWNKTTSRDLRRSHWPRWLRHPKITLSPRSREINKLMIKTRSTCGKLTLSCLLFSSRCSSSPRIFEKKRDFSELKRIQYSHGAFFFPRRPPNFQSIKYRSKMWPISLRASTELCG